MKKKTTSYRENQNYYIYLAMLLLYVSDIVIHGKKTQLGIYILYKIYKHSANWYNISRVRKSLVRALLPLLCNYRIIEQSLHLFIDK